MPALSSKISARSAEFQHNAQAMGQLVADLRAKVEGIKQGGGDAARQARRALRN